jgi:hypothetical protein
MLGSDARSSSVLEKVIVYMLYVVYVVYFYIFILYIFLI